MLPFKVLTMHWSLSKHFIKEFLKIKVIHILNQCLSGREEVILPQANIWKCLETFLVITTSVGRWGGKFATGTW